MLGPWDPFTLSKKYQYIPPLLKHTTRNSGVNLKISEKREQNHLDNFVVFMYTIIGFV